MSVKRMSVARYAVGERDIMEQDCQGGYYIRHVEAMTAEGLHSKSDIAAELAHRDIRIAALSAELAAEKHVGARIEDKLKASMARVVALEAAIRGWMHEGRMQTFGDRERMRAEMASCLPLPPPLPSLPYPWCRQPSVCRGTCPMDPSCGE